MKAVKTKSDFDDKLAYDDLVELFGGGAPFLKEEPIIGVRLDSELDPESPKFWDRMTLNPSEAQQLPNEQHSQAVASQIAFDSQPVSYLSTKSCCLPLHRGRRTARDGNPKRKHKCTARGCGEIFGRRAHLRRHIATHGWGKGFKCHWCEKSFTRPDNLQTHVKKVHLD